MKRFSPLSIYGILITGLLLCLLFLHGMLPDKDYSEVEKRRLQTAPVLTFDSLLTGEFMDRSEDYLSDQFPFRDALMRLKSRFSLLLGNNESNGVYYCRDDSLMSCFTAYDSEQARFLSNNLRKFDETHDFRQCIFLLIPSAVSFYAQQLPAFVESESERTYYDQMVQGLPAGWIAPDSFGILTELMEAGERIYYKSDHHWTSEAALGVFQEIAPIFDWKADGFVLSVVSDSFLGSLVSKSGFTPSQSDNIAACFEKEPQTGLLITHSEEQGNQSSFYHFDKLGTANEYEFFLGGNEPLITVQTTADSDDTLLVLKDSYANCFLPLLAKSYKSITIVDPRYYNQDLESLFLAGSYTDLLILYNIQTLSQDEALSLLLSEED